MTPILPFGVMQGLLASQIQVISSGTTATISPGVRLVLIATGSGNFTLTADTISPGREVVIVKTSTDTNSITLARTSTETINAVAASLVLPGSTSAVGFIAWTAFDQSSTARVVV